MSSIHRTTSVLARLSCSAIRQSRAAYPVWKHPFPLTSCTCCCSSDSGVDNANRNRSGPKSQTATTVNIKKEMDMISKKFSEAIELISDCKTSQNTIYFTEDVTAAQAQVKDCLDSYEKLLATLDGEGKNEVQRAIGLKMSELRTQMKMIEDIAKHS
ncbi:unnamed protein product [Cyprideis torosa]|uniref:Uncharacterized protein n=1 Tax=Cyprideis torosa TaxID=163714 RepID=A0A7R8WPU1_9CRUS|nr:unnamed protein product [Cyprideis torosa]CAG0907233.1 unnamed protein product [Cyprideis torosa]